MIKRLLVLPAQRSLDHAPDHGYAALMIKRLLASEHH
jgi:hypothetical protein